MKLYLFAIILFVLTWNVFLSQSVYAAFPINTQLQIKLAQNTTELSPQQTESPHVINTFKSTNYNQRGEGSGVFGIISICTAVVGYLAPTLGLGLLMILISFITGIAGTQSDKKLKGLAITGLILSAVALILLLIAISIAI